jgi:D-erythronate 2-dehydrogenase
VARPTAPSGLRSAFLSNLFHALRARRNIVLPVSPSATTLLMSVDRAAANLVHALGVTAVGTYTLPALHVNLQDLVNMVAAHTNADPDLVEWRPDPAIETRFGRVPVLCSPTAQAAGFAANLSLEELVCSALADLSDGRPQIPASTTR